MEFGKLKMSDLLTEFTDEATNDVALSGIIDRKGIFPSAMYNDQDIWLSPVERYDMAGGKGLWRFTLSVGIDVDGSYSERMFMPYYALVDDGLLSEGKISDELDKGGEYYGYEFECLDENCSYVKPK